MVPGFLANIGPEPLTAEQLYVISQPHQPDRVAKNGDPGDFTAPHGDSSGGHHNSSCDDEYNYGS